MNKEQVFLQRIAEQLGRKAPLTEKPVREVVGAPDFWQEYQLAEEEKIQRFCENWQALTGIAEVVESETEAAAVLLQWLKEENVGEVIRWNHPELDHLQIDLQCEQNGIHVTVWGHGDGSFNSRQAIQKANKAEVGITWADYAIADTGTLCLFSSNGQARSVSLLPSIHIAIFRAGQLVTRIGEVMAEIDRMNQEQGLPAGINFITGPSRSADIENDLSIGVHGPKKTYALIIKS